MQLVVGVAALLALYPDVGSTAGDVVVPHTEAERASMSF